mmetsp:Transcript_7466/g.33157  ORF Transcript_7466/g.33157 Transcript_7466/m.33157 type:complete len:220 (+) Transcript_7466:4610-5269(+)
MPTPVTSAASLRYFLISSFAARSPYSNLQRAIRVPTRAGEKNWGTSNLSNAASSDHPHLRQTLWIISPCLSFEVRKPVINENPISPSLSRTSKGRPSDPFAPSIRPTKAVVQPRTVYSPVGAPDSPREVSVAISIAATRRRSTALVTTTSLFIGTAAPTSERNSAPAALLYIDLVPIIPNANDTSLSRTRPTRSTSLETSRIHAAATRSDTPSLTSEPM